MGITAQLAAFTAGISLDRLPPEVVNRARFLMLDPVGNIVRARHDAESTPSFLAATRAMGMAAGEMVGASGADVLAAIVVGLMRQAAPMMPVRLAGE
ncbi:MAG TPA: hypothetical protein VGL95_06510 [Acetobacteraceae bacterium]